MRKLESNIQRAIDYLAYNRMREKLRRAPVTLSFYLGAKHRVKKSCLQQTAYRVRKLLNKLVENGKAIKIVLPGREGTIYKPCGAEDWQAYEWTCMCILTGQSEFDTANRKGV
jgi:hypothetical protein